MCRGWVYLAAVMDWFSHYVLSLINGDESTLETLAQVTQLEKFLKNFRGEIITLGA